MAIILEAEALCSDRRLGWLFVGFRHSSSGPLSLASRVRAHLGAHLTNVTLRRSSTPLRTPDPNRAAGSTPRFECSSRCSTVARDLRDFKVVVKVVVKR